MKSDWSHSSMPAVTDVYTNLHGLQNLKVEKDNEVALKKVSQQFESMFINMLLKNMRAANEVFSQGNMFESNDSQFYRDMHDHQLALNLAHGRGFGIADAMYRQLSQAHGTGEFPRERQVQLSVPQQAVHRASSVSDTPAHQGAENSVSIPFAMPAEENKIQTGRSQIAQSPLEFIQKVLPSAKNAAAELGVEKEILIAQAALETGWGRQVFAQESGKSTYNLFNIKADSRWSGDSVATSTLEFLGGQFKSVSSRFRNYENIQQSFDDFTQFIKNSERYKGALEHAQDSLKFIQNIHEAGYATDPDYSAKVGAVYQSVKSLMRQATDAGVNL